VAAELPPAIPTVPRFDRELTLLDGPAKAFLAAAYERPGPVLAIVDSNSLSCSPCSRLLMRSATGRPDGS